MKSDNFKIELGYIKNERLESSAKTLIEEIPEYFFHVAASSTGKYHPSFSLGDGGLLRHTKAAVKIAKSLLDDPLIGDKYTSDEKDLMMISLIFHDSIKHGFTEEKYTRFDHPLLAAEFLENNKEKSNFTSDEIEFMAGCIKTHMGPWNKDYVTGEEVLPLPKTKYQNFVHMCDYLASRKFLDVTFKDNEIVE